MLSQTHTSRTESVCVGAFSASLFAGVARGSFLYKGGHALLSVSRGDHLQGEKATCFGKLDVKAEQIQCSRDSVSRFVLRVKLMFWSHVDE